MPIEDALKESKEDAKPVVDEGRIAELAAEKVAEKLASMPAARPQVQYVQAPAPQVSNFDRVAASLKEAYPDIDEAAIRNSARITAAVLADREAQAAPQSAQAIQNAFVRACEDKTEEALDVLGAPIPAFVEGGQGLKVELRNRVANLLLNDKRFNDVAEKLRAGSYPPSRRLNEACAEVIDGYCKRAGIQKPGGPPDLSSSKPSRPSENSDDPSDLQSKSAKFIYNATIKLGKSKDYALKLAKQEDRGMRERV